MRKRRSVVVATTLCKAKYQPLIKYLPLHRLYQEQESLKTKLTNVKPVLNTGKALMGGEYDTLA